jgi:hypothetical protein
MQDDSYLESYISTIGVDFVSNSSACALCVSIMYLYVHQPSYAHVHVLSLIGQGIAEFGHCSWPPLANQINPWEQFIIVTSKCCWMSWQSEIFSWFVWGQKIRTVELDGKTIKLQIVSIFCHFSFAVHNTSWYPFWQLTWTSLFPVTSIYSDYCTITAAVLAAVWSTE